MADEHTAADTPGQLEPTWRGFNNCDFCGQPLEAKDRLYGACVSCQQALKRQA